MQLPGGDIACAFGGSDDDDLSAIWRVLKQNSRIRVEPGVPPRSRALPGGARWGVVTVQSISIILLLNFASFALLPSPEWCAQASQGESVKWIETRLSGPERNQLATPSWAHEEGPECRSTTVVKPLPDRVSPHLEE